MIEGVLLDLGGVVYVGDEPLPGAVEAVGRLRDAGLGLRFLTNTTRTPRRALLGKVAGLGLSVAESELFMPAIAARQVLEAQRLTPHLLIHPALEEEARLVLAEALYATAEQLERDAGEFRRRGRAIVEAEAFGAMVSGS